MTTLMRDLRYTIGGMKGHLFRRTMHLGMAIVPFLYYAYADAATRHTGLSAKLLVWLILGLTLLLEAIRFKFGLIVFGQREIERKQISSVASGLFGICLVLLLAPSSAYAIPIIVSCAVVDPLVGELRHTQWARGVWSWIIGIVAAALIWCLSSVYFGTPSFWIVWMAPLVVLLERPNIRWIDDNLLMLLGPLLLVRIVSVL